jgi:hypothetical protein
MRTYLAAYGTRLLVAALALVVGSLVAHWMISSPAWGQEGGADPVPNQESPPCSDSF